MSTIVMKPKKPRTAKCAPYLARQMSKWFYDTSTGAAPREQPTVVLLLEGAFGLLVASYERSAGRRCTHAPHDTELSGHSVL
jgi:hypothetical protein